MFDRIIWEPSKWSYQEPFTSEIRRLAGCIPTPEYSLIMPKHSDEELSFHHANNSSRAIVSISRDIYKRHYGRNINEFINRLSEFADIRWIGLDADQNSKHGKRKSLSDAAKIIYNSDIFVGPEGGMLWIAAGLDKPTIYFTEHILEVEKVNDVKNLDRILGSKNLFPQKLTNIPLAPFCSNNQAIETIKQTLFHMTKQT